MHMPLAEGLDTRSCYTARMEGMCVRLPFGFFADWYKAHGRSFPWREEDISPFGILLAEVLLKQTRAEMVAEVWPALFRKYPNAASLESARPEELHHDIACLGFGHQRVKGLRQLSAAINRTGRIPSRPAELMKLPHVGVYSAHAVACFAFGLRVPVVDLSVVRVLSRLAGIEPPRDIRRAPEVWEIARSLLPDTEVKEHNYGLLDFAADICKARSPQCEECLVAPSCAYAKHLVRIREQDITAGDHSGASSVRKEWRNANGCGVKPPWGDEPSVLVSVDRRRTAPSIKWFGQQLGGR